MLEGSLLKAMEAEHCTRLDKNKEFNTSNGVSGATAEREWEFVFNPDTSRPGRYVERGGDFRKDHPSWCRKPELLSVYQEKMADVNRRLDDAGQSRLIDEELIAGRLCAFSQSTQPVLSAPRDVVTSFGAQHDVTSFSRPPCPRRYTGPMYEKYNGVLRFSTGRNAQGKVRLQYDSESEVPFLQKKCGELWLGEWVVAEMVTQSFGVRWEWHNKYETTIHAINSIVVKMARLTKIVPLFRGWTGATLPSSFFKPDDFGLCGGVEYGFSSTTTDRQQAVHYAQGKASTVLECVPQTPAPFPQPPCFSIHSLTRRARTMDGTRYHAGCRRPASPPPPHTPQVGDGNGRPWCRHFMAQPMCAPLAPHLPAARCAKTHAGHVWHDRST
jgi:hypothetical protein